MEYYAAERIPTFYNSTDGTGDYYAKWNKPVSKRQIPYDLTYNYNLMNKLNEKIEPETETWNRLTTVVGEERGEQ